MNEIDTPDSAPDSNATSGDAAVPGETAVTDNTGTPDAPVVPDTTSSPEGADAAASPEPQSSSATAEPQAAPAVVDPPATHLHGTEHRDSARHIVRWHADVLIDGHPCQGIVHEVSESGVTVFLELNPQKAKKLLLNIHVPPLDDKHGQHIVEVEGKIVYSIHDSEEQLFRAGIHFSRFAQDSDSAFLASYLNGH